MDEASKNRLNHVHARPDIVRLHQSGTTERMKPIPENTENALLRAVVLCSIVFLKLPEERDTKVFKLV